MGREEKEGGWKEARGMGRLMRNEEDTDSNMPKGSVAMNPKSESNPDGRAPAHCPNAQATHTQTWLCYSRSVPMKLILWILTSKLIIQVGPNFRTTLTGPLAESMRKLENRCLW